MSSQYVPYVNVHDEGVTTLGTKINRYNMETIIAMSIIAQLYVKRYSSADCACFAPSRFIGLLECNAFLPLGLPLRVDIRSNFILHMKL